MEEATRLETQVQNLFNVGGNFVALLPVPNACPICHKQMVPMTIAGYALPSGDVEFLLRCANVKCQHVFIADCHEESTPHQSGRKTYSLVGVKPQTANPSSFPPIINETSPTFVEIYGQAMKAESENLDQLVGVGLRKALEFLVKDYLIGQHPNKKNEIEKTMLGPCIADNVDDSRLKQCAQRAAWLGNDETHYVRKWTNKDVSDLKTLIHLTVLWIEQIHLTNQYLSAMPSTGAPPATTPGSSPSSGTV